ncbi:MAG: ATP-dependent helicase HrpB [Bryobacterales bacterium]|nr:ATP-dependent helicase HrpB [Bryobacterales bacterium]
MTSLPIDPLIADILASLRARPNLVIEAPPGAGKTTRVPAALLGFGGEVLVLEPRRLAARMAARRVAEELGEPLGETVGYQVRFEEVSSAKTRLRFLTEGVLTRRLLSDPELRGVGCVVLDEFHERHLEGDLALALLRRLQQRSRPELRLVVMSATLDGGAVADYLDGCPRVRSAGRLFPIDVEYTPHSAAPLEEQVRGAVDRILRRDTGDALVFLPGAAEIRRAMRACEDLARPNNLLLLPLYGDLAPAEQDRAVLPAGQRKIVFSTNVAESSLTIEGVTAVIDSGLARVARDNPYNGLPTLEVARVSKASAVQRAGRAGRTAPGIAVRLFSQEDFNRRAEAETPEIRRRELSQMLLTLAAMRVRAQDLPWFDPPPEQALAAADELLNRLGAYQRGKELARLPLHPRLATLVAECPTDDACAVAAAISAGDRAPSPDVFSLLEAEPSYQARRLRDMLRRQVRTRKGTDEQGTDEQLRRGLLTAFPDRVVRAHTVSLPPSAITLKDKPLLLAIDVEQRRESNLPLVRLATAVSAELIFDVFPERVTDQTSVEWNRTAERVEARSALIYDGIVIEETRSGATPTPEASSLLAQKALEVGVARFTDIDELTRLIERCAFAARFTSLPPVDIELVLQQACEGLRSFAELEQVDFHSAVMARFTPQQRQLLDQIAPDRIRLPGGRQTKVFYASDKDPWIASRLQDFFGMRETPRIANGQAPLTLHLLAPNQRPVQTTKDLAGFWERLYPQLRRELGRRYPKHKWPENPLKPAEL